MAKTSREDLSGHAHTSRTAAPAGLWTKIMGLLPLAMTKPPGKN